MLEEYLSQVHQVLKEGGCLLLGMSETMADLPLMQKIAT